MSETKTKTKLLRVSKSAIRTLEETGERPPGYYDQYAKLSERETSTRFYISADRYEQITRWVEEERSRKPWFLKARRAVRTVARVLGRGAKAGASVAKTSVGIDTVTDEQYKARLDVCQGCPGGHATFDNGKLYTCGEMIASLKREGKGTCGCVLSRKARDKKQDCPFGYWPRITD